MPLDRSAVAALVSKSISEKVDKKYVDFVLVKEGLTSEEKFGLTAFGSGGIYVIRDALYIDPTEITNTGLIIDPLTQLLSLPRADIEFKLSLRPARYVRILRRMSFATKDMLDERIE